nr:MAG TPA: thymidylate synthase, flavin-dependent [Caudoviricetes sp.]
MYMTTNLSTTQVGQSTATVLARTWNPTTKQEIITWELMYPRYIHSELMTHRQFSRNAASSRATPTRVLVEEVRKHPAFFDEVRLNQKGMTGGELVGDDVLKEFKRQWEDAANTAADYAENWLKMGIAKQTVNRILEPFLPIRTIVTATDIDNFFKLRLAPDAQPEIQSLAKAMNESREKAGVSVEEVHIPYAEYFTDKTEHLVARAIAACARVSVARNDGKKTTYEEDLAFTKRLLSAGHMTPFEHVAYAASSHWRYANFSDWMSMRWIAEHQPEAKDVR